MPYTPTPTASDHANHTVKLPPAALSLLLLLRLLPLLFLLILLWLLLILLTPLLMRLWCWQQKTVVEVAAAAET